MTPTGYTGEAALAAARAVLGVADVAAGSTRELFATRTALVVAAVAMGDAGEAEAEGCAAAVARVDALVTRLHGLFAHGIT